MFSLILMRHAFSGAKYWLQGPAGIRSTCPTLRLWIPAFRQERITVCVRSDNLSALEMVAKMQPKSKSLNVVARELALDLASSTYDVDFAQHVAGITNGIADTLSRKHQAGKVFVLPPFLNESREVRAPSRGKSWSRTKPVN